MFTAYIPYVAVHWNLYQ